MYSLDKNFFFRFGTIVVVFCLYMWKGVADSKKAKLLSKRRDKKAIIRFDDHRRKLRMNLKKYKILKKQLK